MILNYRIPTFLLIAAFSVLSVARAEEWEIGGAVGWAFTKDQNITRANTTAKVGSERAAAISFFVSHREHRRLGGDFYYTQRMGDLKLDSGGTAVRFDSTSHLVHYDLTYHPFRADARIDPYFGAGGGVRVFRGTGRETAFQGLNQIAVISRTQEILPLLSVAAGVRMKLSKHSAIRFEFRDNITPFPGKVIAVNPQANAPKWWHDFTPQVGFGVVF